MGDFLIKCDNCRRHCEVGWNPAEHDGIWLCWEWDFQ